MDWIITFIHPSFVEPGLAKLSTIFRRPIRLRDRDVLLEDVKDGSSLRACPLDGLEKLTPTFRLGCPSGFFRAIWPSGLFSDLIIKVNGTEFNVHRAVLGSASPFFLTLLRRMNGADPPVLRITEVDSLLFKQLLDLIYGERVPVTGLRTLRLLIMARYFQITGLTEQQIIEQVECDEEEIPDYIELVRILS